MRVSEQLPLWQQLLDQGPSESHRPEPRQPFDIHRVDDRTHKSCRHPVQSRRRSPRTNGPDRRIGAPQARPEARSKRLPITQVRSVLVQERGTAISIGRAPASPGPGRLRAGGSRFGCQPRFERAPCRGRTSLARARRASPALPALDGAPSSAIGRGRRGRPAPLGGSAAPWPLRRPVPTWRCTCCQKPSSA